MAQLFLVLAARYGHKWTSQVPTDPTALEVFRGVWRQGLREACLTLQAVERGLDRWRKAGNLWPPGVDELVEVSRLQPADIGAPDPETAYVDACHRRWSHAIVFLACQKVGGALQLQADGRRGQARYLDAYGDLLRRALAGEQFEIPEVQGPRLAYEQPSQVTAPGDARTHLRAMRQRLTGRAS